MPDDGCIPTLPPGGIIIPDGYTLPGFPGPGYIAGGGIICCGTW